MRSLALFVMPVLVVSSCGGDGRARPADGSDPAIETPIGESTVPVASPTDPADLGATVSVVVSSTTTAAEQLTSDGIEAVAPTTEPVPPGTAPTTAPVPSSAPPTTNEGTRGGATTEAIRVTDRVTITIIDPEDE